MSYWTRVSGCIDVAIPINTSIQDKVTKYIEWCLHTLDKNSHNITGTEGNVKFHIVPKEYYTWDSLKYEGNKYSMATIFLNTNLRDRLEEQVMLELRKFLNNLTRYVSIDRLDISVGYKRLTGIEYYDENDYTLKEDEELFIIKEDPKDKLYNIQKHNWIRWNNIVYNTDDKIKEAVECLTSLSKNKLEEVLNESNFDRIIDWDFNPSYLEWLGE